MTNLYMYMYLYTYQHSTNDYSSGLLSFYFLIFRNIFLSQRSTMWRTPWHLLDLVLGTSPPSPIWISPSPSPSSLLSTLPRPLPLPWPPLRRHRCDCRCTTCTYVMCSVAEYAPFPLILLEAFVWVKEESTQIILHW